MPHVAHELFNPSVAHEFNPVFSGVRVTRSFVFNVVFCRYLFTISPFSFAHCIDCPSIYGFWLPLWYLQTFLAILFKHFCLLAPKDFWIIWFPNILIISVYDECFSRYTSCARLCVLARWFSRITVIGYVRS